MKCERCGEELQKIPVLGNTKEFFYYCNNCFRKGGKLKDYTSPIFREKREWRARLNGHK